VGGWEKGYKDNKGDGRDKWNKGFKVYKDDRGKLSKKLSYMKGCSTLPVLCTSFALLTSKLVIMRSLVR